MYMRACESGFNCEMYGSERESERGGGGVCVCVYACLCECTCMYLFAGVKAGFCGPVCLCVCGGGRDVCIFVRVFECWCEHENQRLIRRKEGDIAKKAGYASRER